MTMTAISAALLLGLLHGSPVPCLAKARTAVPSVLDQQAKEDPKILELKKMRDEMLAVKEEMAPLLKRIEELRHSYVVSGDPRGFAGPRDAVRGQLTSKLLRFRELRENYTRLSAEIERGKYAKALGRLTGQGRDSEGLDREYVAIQEIKIFFRGVNDHLQGIAIVLVDEEAEYGKAMKGARRRRQMLMTLAGVLLAIAGMSAWTRWRTRVLTEPVALPHHKATGSSYILLAGDFRLESEWGRDRLGIAYGATDVRNKRPVSVWLLREDSGMSAAGVKAAAAAADRAGQVRHPGLARVLSVLFEDDRLCLVLEPPSGRPLSVFLRDGRKNSLSSVAEVFSHIAAALDFAHSRGVVHGGLRLSTIALASDGKVQVLGLGVPQEESAAHMAPEQLAGGPLPASDQFSLCVCAYELLTGSPPYPGPDHAEQKRRMLYLPPSQVVAGLPKALDEALRKGLTPDPAGRYRSCGEFAAALEPVLARRRDKPGSA